MHRSVGSFVEALESAGELARVSEPVSPVLELSAIADRMSKCPAPGPPSESAREADPRYHGLGGRAMLFENVEGSEIPVLINAYGSYRRMEMALGCTDGGFAEIAGRIAELVKPQPPRSLGEAIRKARQFAPLLRIGPRRRKGGACQSVVHRGREADLRCLPIIRCWPHDGDPGAVGYPAGLNDAIPGCESGEAWEGAFRGRYITLGGVHTVHADDDGADRPPSHNIGMYRVQMLGPRLMAMHWQMHHDGAKHWRSWRRRGERMPVAIALGGESVLPYAATCPLPPGISELLMAGFLNGRGIEMTRGVTVPLWVPANAEIVIEGYVAADAGAPGWDPRGSEPLGPGSALEGPFGDHTGFYSLPDRYPTLEVTAITHRASPVFPATVVGLPPQEDYFLGKATERIMLPLLRTILPDIVDYDLPMFGAFHNAASIRIEKEYPLHARRVMHGVWGAGQMSWTKSVFVVGDGVDVHDSRRVLGAMAANCDPSGDIEIVRGPTDVLDHATPYLGAGAKLGFDCTRRTPGEEASGAAPASQPRSFAGPASDGMAALLARIERVPGVLGAAFPPDLDGWLFVRADKDVGEDAGAGVGARVAAAVAAEVSGTKGAPAYVVLVGRGVRLDDTERVLFHWAANFDASRDLHLAGGPGSACAVFDATPKVPGDARAGQPVRDWPPILTMDPATARAIEAIAARVGLSEISASLG